MKAKPILSHKRNQSETTLKRVASSFELPQIKTTNTTNTSSLLSSKNPTPSDKGNKSTNRSSTRSDSTTIMPPTFKKSDSSISTTHVSPRYDILKKTIMNFQNIPVTIPSPSSSSNHEQNNSSNMPTTIKSVKSETKLLPKSQSILKQTINTMNFDPKRRSNVQSQNNSPTKTSIHQSPEQSPMKFGKPTQKKTIFLLESKENVESNSPSKRLKKVASCASIADSLDISPKRLSPRKPNHTNPSFGQLASQLAEQGNKENQSQGILKVMPMLIQDDGVQGEPAVLNEIENEHNATENVENPSKFKKLFKKAKTQDEMALMRSKSKKRVLMKQGSIDLEERIKETFIYRPHEQDSVIPNFSPKIPKNDTLKPIDNQKLPYFLKENVLPRQKANYIAQQKKTFEYESPTSFFSTTNNVKNDVFLGDGVKFFEINENSKIYAESQTPRALRLARQKMNLDKTYSQLKKDYSPVILSYYDKFDTRIVQPKFMEKFGSMCTSELWPNQTKKEYFYRMKDHATIKKTYDAVDGLYRPDKNKKKDQVHDDKMVL